HTHRKRCAAVERPNRIDQSEACADRSLRVVVVGARISEVDEQPIAKILRDVPAMAINHAGRHVLVAAHRLAPLLRIEPAREPCRADQVAEEHRQLAALSLRSWCDGVIDRSSRRRRLGVLQRCAATTAEFFPELVLLPAGSTLDRELSAAPGAELPAFPILTTA